MFEDFLDVLACPDCQQSFRWECVAPERSHGWLCCNRCASRAPVLSGILFWTETELDAGPRPNLEAEWYRLRGSDVDWDTYLQQRSVRQNVEPYAAFAPFNESTRSITRFITPLRQMLKPGDLIVDLSNRTGWSGDYLAGAFPDARVVAIWEGDSSVLGYRGFLRYFEGRVRPKNLLPVFSPPNARLPLKESSASIVHAYDSLHRARQPQFLNECLRLAAEKGTVLAPHIHLSNSEPDPYFSRGGQLRHGATYRDWLTTRLREDGRQVRIYSELDLFERDKSSQLINDSASTTHYNGFAAVGTPALFATMLAIGEPDYPPDPEIPLLINPLLRVNPLTGRIQIDDSALGGQTRHLLTRHPAYEQRLLRSEKITLNKLHLFILLNAAKGCTIREITARLNVPDHEIRDRVVRLAESELVIPAPISVTMHNAQLFHTGNREIIDTDILRCWTEWVSADPNRIACTVFGSSLTRVEADTMFRSLLAFALHANCEMDFHIDNLVCNSAIGICTLALQSAGYRYLPSSSDSSASLSLTSDDDILLTRQSSPSIRLSEIIAAFDDDTDVGSNRTTSPMDWWVPLVETLSDIG